MVKKAKKNFVYIVRCKYGTYYTGYTNDLEKRIEFHNNGNGAKYLRGKGPVKLVYKKKFKSRKNALKAERKIKKLTRKEKEELIAVYLHTHSLRKVKRIIK